MMVNRLIVNLLISIIQVLITIQLLINKVISNNQANIIKLLIKSNIIKNTTVIKS
jgi:hypothetical protein